MTHKATIFTGILALTAGIVLSITFASITSYGVIITGGILFILAGVIDLLLFAGRKSVGTTARVFAILSAVAAILLGLSLLAFTNTFTVLIPYIFGALLIIAALMQFYIQAIGVRPYQLPGWLYTFPLLILGGAIYVLTCTAATDDAPIMLTTGIALALFGLALVLEGIMLAHYTKKTKNNTTPETTISSPTTNHTHTLPPTHTHE